MFDKHSYHFIGIGGIGISAIARMLVLQGKKVSGSDSNSSEITELLGKLGVTIYIGHNANNILESTEVVIYSVAIPESNPELQEARRRGLLCVTYPEALGELSKNMFTIAVSGTHGKTTTTAMIGHIMKKAGLDPTIIVGSKMLSDEEKNGVNFLAGKSKYLVVEACEYKRSFLNIHPTVLVITNIEADHLDYYKNLDDINSAFQELTNKVPANGKVVREANYMQVSTPIELLTPGTHNILNAKTAIKAVESVGVTNEKAAEYLKDFKGTWRRLEYKGEKDGAIFYDDYAHHPTAIRGVLKTLREKYPDRKLIAVFEPHQQKRTIDFFSEFVQALSLADYCFVAPIYVTREIRTANISNEILAQEINKNVPAFPVQDLSDLTSKLKEIQGNICVVMMGAGDIYKWTPYLLE